MKIHRFFVQILIFFCILLFFVFPPIFSKNNFQSSFNWNFNYFSFFYSICGLFIYLYFYKKKDLVYKNNKFLNIGYGIKTFGILFIIQAILQLINYYFSFQEENLLISKPNSIIFYFIILINFFSASLYEELLYRIYLPESLLMFCKKINNKIFSKIIPEIISIILFGLGHLYLGFIAVINAIISGIFLRLCYTKTHSLFINVLVHFLYNVITFMFIILN